MDNARNHGENTPRGMTRRRCDAIIGSIDALSHRHGRRLSRWMTTWDSVDCSLLGRMILQASETRTASRIAPESIPVLDHIQTQADAELASAIERVEHLIVMCNKVSRRDSA
ncbi:MAG: hypothetical protein VX641_05255 [Planctomycetota bacterium]|nr:hypothetical protein [Planctomycetota bacterium]